MEWKRQKKHIIEQALSRHFDKTTGQNFVTYQKGHTTVSIWLEDETSVKSRLELMKKYNLAGAAYWSLGQEKADIWNIIDQYFE